MMYKLSGIKKKIKKKTQKRRLNEESKMKHRDLNMMICDPEYSVFYLFPGKIKLDHLENSQRPQKILRLQNW